MRPSWRHLDLDLGIDLDLDIDLDVGIDQVLDARGEVVGQDCKGGGKGKGSSRVVGPAAQVLSINTSLMVSDRVGSHEAAISRVRLHSIVSDRVRSRQIASDRCIATGAPRVCTSLYPCRRSRSFWRG